MNRSFKDYAGVGAGHQLRRHSLNSFDHHQSDLFSASRRAAASIQSSDDSSDLDRTTSFKLGNISVGSATSAKSGLDDLLTSTDGGKHDYDWLLTPPETPLFASAKGSEFQQSFTTPRNSSARSVATAKPSRLSTSHQEGSISSRPARSSSVTRSSISYSQSSNYSSMRSSSILNTSSASVSSYIRPSSPVTRPSSTSRPSTPTRTNNASSVRTTPSRSSTPSKARSAPTLSSLEKPRPSLGSRPSTPGSRPQVSSNITSSPATLSSSRPSTPTRRNSISSSSPTPNLSSSTVRTLSNTLSNGRSKTSTSRPSSPGPRIRPQQAVIPPDFSLDTPPNLRTTLPDRPVSAGRSRPAPAVTPKANAESQGHGGLSRRASSPVVSRGRSVEPKARNHLSFNGHSSELQEPKKSSYAPESPSRRSLRTSTVTESAGLGRTISKKSLDMALKHMEIRSGPGTVRPIGGTGLYPQSIRSAASRAQPSHPSTTPASTDRNGRLSVSDNGHTHTLETNRYANGALEPIRREENNRKLGRVGEVDMFESCRYDALLLKEDAKNTNWLLGGDEKSDQGLVFDHGFEPLPEPFGLP